MFSLLRKLSGSPAAPPVEAGDADVFISYARADAARVGLIEERLREWGWDIWRDRQLENGKPYEPAIVQRLNAAKCVLVLWSPAAVASEWVTREANLAADADKLFHAMIEPCAPAARFLKMHYHDLTSWDGKPGHEKFAQLLDQLSRRIGPKQKHAGTLLLPRGDEKIGDDHLAIVHTSWRRADLDEGFGGSQMYQIHLMLVGQPSVLDCVESAIYYFDPSYPVLDPEEAKRRGVKTPMRIGMERARNFGIYELANGYSLVRANVKIKAEPELVSLSRFVNLQDAGPRLAEQFIEKRGPGSDPDRA